MNIHLSATETILAKSYYRKDFDGRFDMWFHTHEYLEIMYCNSGSFLFSTLGGDKQVNFTREIKRNEFVVINGSVYHRILIGKECNITNVEFETGRRRMGVMHIDFASFFAENGLIREVLSAETQFVVLNDLFSLSKTINALVKNLLIGNRESEMAQCLIYQTFLEIVNCYNSHTNKNSGICYIKSAIDYINRRFAENTTVNEIAAAVGVSKSYLERLFKTNFNTTVLQYMMNKRIGFVKQALLNTDYTIEEICRKYGFKSKAQLVYEFKKQEKCTPLQFRISSDRSSSANAGDYNERSIRP